MSKKEQIITNEMDESLINTLKNYIDEMDINFEDTKLSKYIYNNIKLSINHQETITHDYQLLDFKKSKIMDNKFMSKNIVKKINKELHFLYKIHFNFKNINFYINIYFENKIDIEKYLYYIKLVLCFCLNEIENKENKNFFLNLFLLKDKKKVDMSKFLHNITSDHINSGFCSHDDNNMNIVIYRKEEWIKVFLHECMHAFNMDFHTENIIFKSIFNETFFINSDFLVYESFVEFWAKIINCALFTYHLKPKISFDNFHKIFTLNINIERIFSIIQANKLLKLFDLSYSNIIDKKYEKVTKNLYHENTNAFCYYIITAIMMCKLEHTIQWYDIHNINTINFDKSERQILIFCHYLNQLAKNKDIIDKISYLDVNKIQQLNSMKMSIFEIDI